MKEVATGENLVSGSIIKNHRGEYGMILSDGRVLILPKDRAEKLVAELKAEFPSGEQKV